MLKVDVGLIARRSAIWKLVLVISVPALALRLLPLLNTWLWSDEIFSISLAEAGFVKAFLGTVRHDLHPPVYYLQLVPWAAIFPGDRGLLLNSIMWDMARLAITVIALYRISGVSAALLGGLAGAFLGSSLYNSENLRMYAMMGFAIVAAWSLTERIFTRSGRPSWRDGMLLLVMQIMIVGSHGAGPFFVSFVVLHGAIIWLQMGGGWRERLPWVCAQAMTGIVSLLVIANGAVRATEHYQIEWTWLEILIPLSFMSAGTSLLGSTVGILIAATLTCIIIAFGLAARRSRLMTFVYVLAPIFLSLLVSAIAKPIYGFRILACAAVFLPLILGISFAELRRAGNRTGQILVFIATLGMVTFGIHQRIYYKKDHDYPALASFMHEQLRPGDVILQYHQPATAWALGRYLIGPGWGDIMSVQHPNSEKWVRMLARLGQPIEGLFKAETDLLWYKDIKIGLGERAANALVTRAERVWVVATFVYDADAVPEVLRSRHPNTCMDFRGAFICRYDMKNR